MKNGLSMAAGLALAVGTTCTPALAGGTSLTPALSAQANKQMNLRNSAVESLDVPAEVGRGFGLDVNIGGVGYSLDLAPYRVRSGDFFVQTWDDVNGYAVAETPGLTTVRGVVVGDGGSVIAGGLVSGGIRLQVVFGNGDMYMIEPLRDAAPGTHVIYENTDVITDPAAMCGMPAVDGIDFVPKPAEGGVAGGTLCVELAIDCDFDWFQIFGSVPACVAEANAIINAVNLQWEPEVGLSFLVTGVIVRQSPLYNQTDAENLLCQFSNEWSATNPVPNRDLAHLFTGKELNGGTIGIAAEIGSICDSVSCGTFPCNCPPWNTAGSYCLSQTEFDSNFGCSTDLVSHEMGHLFNAFHCNCPSNTMNPFITCANTFTAGTIGSITAYAAGLPCLDANCEGGGPCPGQGSCFYANGTVGCDDEACCNAVCAADAFCCETEWDQICANSALELCANAACPGAGDCFVANGTPGCSDNVCCNAVCIQDPFCCDNQWDGICANEAIEICAGGPPTGACCFPDGSCVETTQADCGGVYQGDGTTCADANCPQPGCPGEGNCYFPNGTPGCDNAGCCEIVCAADPFCCNTEWDGLCAGAANDLCGNPVCPGEGDCCEANGSVGCNDQACCNAVCAADPFCCNNTWDGLCASQAADLCGDLCAGPACACDGVGDDEGEPCGEDTNGGCNSTPPAFGSIACGQTICGTAWADGGTRDTDWFLFSTTAACTLVTATLQAEADSVVFIVDGIDACAPVVIGTTGGSIGCVPGAASAEVGPGNYVVFVASAAFDGAPCGTPNGYNVTLTCGECKGGPVCPGEGSCCEPNGTVGCDDLDCCELICAQDPFCCDVEWDQACANQANDQCSVCTPPTGACCLPDGSCVETTPGGCAGEGVYQGDGTLCSQVECPVPFECPGEGDCCEPNGTPGCNDLECCELTCDQDPFCCDNSWDGLCTNFALENCAVCQSPCPGEGCCFEANGTVGCVIEACCNAVCDVDPFCCETEWDGICAGEAVDICYNPICPGDTNGDLSVDVQDLVNVILAWGQTGHSPFDVDPNCLVDVGDLIAVILNWGPCQGCGFPNAGPCGEPNGTPYCNDADCCETVCANDAFCCDIEWDQICANAALELCQGGCAEEGEPCGEDLNGGCNSTPTAFGSISCGGAVCGNAWADGGTRDTDWYLVTVDGECTTLTATLNAGFEAVLFIVDGIDACAPVVIGTAGDGAGNPAFADVGPGTYVVFVAAAAFDGTPCGTTNGYEVSLECTPCPSAASSVRTRPSTSNLAPVAVNGQQRPTANLGTVK